MDRNLHQPSATPSSTVPNGRGWHVTKIVFHCLSIVFCIVVLGISISLYLNSPAAIFILVWTIPQVVVALCWSIAELITICARTGQRGIHPGAHVALHLLLWLGFCVSVGFNGWILAFVMIYADYYDYGYYDFYDSYNSSRYVGSIQALVAFLSLLIITHFVLFVGACVETARRNRSSPPVIMVPAPVYYQQPPQHGCAMQQYPAPAGYPTQPPTAHISGQYEQAKEPPHYVTGSSTGHTFQPSVSP